MAEKSGANTVNRTGLAAVHGVSMPTVDAWVRAGCPVVRKGGRGLEWEFDPAAVFKWRMERALAEREKNQPDDMETIERRKALALAMEAELRLAKAKEEVAPVAEFERAWARAFAELQTNILNVPQRVILSLLGETDETRFKQVLRAELVAALEQTARAEITLGGEDDDAADDA